MTRPRLRDLGISIGSFPPGPHNAITDVPGVSVGHTTVIHDAPRIARTGVTVILPRETDVGRDHCFAGFHSFNGNGEMTGTHWLKESGLLVSPIALTSTHYVGIAHQALVEYSSQHGFANTWSLPVVAETYDGFLNDADAMHLKPAHVLQAIKSASAGAVAEGNVGGGTGMVCHEFKGGIGTSSRVVQTDNGPFTVGVVIAGLVPLSPVNRISVSRPKPNSSTFFSSRPASSSMYATSSANHFSLGRVRSLSLNPLLRGVGKNGSCVNAIG